MQQSKVDNSSFTKMESFTLNDIEKPASRYLPQDLQSAFDSAADIPLPDLGWFPKQWGE
jgi:hypothetical protein